MRFTGQVVLELHRALKEVIVGNTALAVFVALSFCATSTFAVPEMSYTNWPAVTPWTDLTNHISWCYKALSERLLVDNRAAETNDILPSYVWPYNDYVRFAEKIDSLAPSFVCQTNDLNDHFKTYLIAQRSGAYPTALPCWDETRLHRYAFSNEKWSTNSPLHSWMGTTNHAIQVEVQNAITCLVWTVVESSSREAHKYYQCSQYNSSSKANPCWCDADPYPSGYTNAVSLAKSYEANRWTAGKIVDGPMGWGNAIYAVGGMLCVSSPTYVGGSPTYTYTVYGARMYAKPVLENVCTDFFSRASVFLSMRHYSYNDYLSYKNYWYTYDYNSVWFGGRSVQTNHLVFVQEFNPLRTSKYSGDYPFYDLKNVNPATRGWVSVAYTKTCEHIYCDSAQWLLKWDVAGGVSMTPPPVGMGDKIAETPDVDRDDIVEVPADMRSLGRDFGSITILPECDSPVVLIPLAATPAWFGSLPIYAYVSQGAFTNLPYAYHVKPHADNDGYYTAYSLNTHVEESGALRDKRAGWLKRVELVRPRGNVVIFDFKYETDGFSDKGYPIGANKNRTYVLRDLTPGVHSDKKFELCFASGIVHEFDENGYLVAVRHADGRRVAVNSTSFPSASILMGAEDVGPTSAVGSCYSVAVKWDKCALKQIDYASLRSPTQTVTTAIALDGEKFIQALSKSGADGAFGKSGVSISNSLVIYGSGVKVSRSATAVAGVARTVTVATSIPDVGTQSAITEFDAGDKVVRSELSGAAGERAVTRYSYVGTVVSSRYANGFPKQSKLKMIEYPDGLRENFDYTDGEGWLSRRTAPSGAGFDRVTEYVYDVANDYDAANVTNAVERPRKIEAKVGGTSVGRTLFGYGARGVEIQVCQNASAEWNDKTNLKSCKNFYTDGVTAGLPQEYFSYQISADDKNYTYSVDSGVLTSKTFCGDGKFLMSCVNAFGVCESSATTENGETTDASSSTVDLFGRPLETTLMNGTVTRSGYGLYGPATVTGVDGSSSSYRYFDHGPVSRVVDNSSEITTDYVYDPFGNVIKTTVAGGGKTVVTTAEYDALGRLTSSRDGLGGTTTYSYEKTSFGTRKTTALPSGGSVIEERYFDGNVKRICGSAAAARVNYEYGIEGSVYYSKVKNDDHAGEYETTYYNFLGKPARMKHSGSSGETVFHYDSAGRPVGSEDETGIARINTYNGQNLLEHSGTDVDRNGKVDLAGADNIETRTRTVSRQGVGYETTTYQAVGNSAANSVCSSVTAFDGRSGSFSEYGRSGTFLQSRYAARGTYSVAAEYSDGTDAVLGYEKWRLSSVQKTPHEGWGDAERTEYGYDGLGRLETVTAYRNLIARTTRYGRDSKGRVSSVLCSDGSPGVLSVEYYDKTDRVKRIVRTDGSAVSYDYDDAGRLIREHDTGTQDKRYSYDALGRLIRLTAFRDGVAQTTGWDHDSVTGLPQAKTVDGIVAETYAYRDNGQLSSVSDANGVTVAAAYDGAGNMTGVTASDGSASVTRTLDRLGRSIGECEAGGVSVSRTLSPEGHALAETVAGSGVVSNAVLARAYAEASHDGLLEFSCAVDGGPTNTFSVGYDLAARVCSVSDGAVSADIRYPGDTPLGTSVTVTACDRLLTRSVQWDFENARPLAVTYTLDGTAVFASHAYAYASGSGRVASETLADGTVRSYAYDTRGRLLSADTALPDGSAVPGQNFAYAYDSAGNPVKAGPLRLPDAPRYSFSCDSRDVHVARAWGNVFEISGTAVPGATVKVGNKIARRQGSRFWAAMTVDNAASAVRTNIVVSAFRRDPALGKDVVACATGVLTVAKADEVPVYDGNAAMTGNSRLAYAWDAFGRLRSADNAPLLTANPSLEGRRVVFDYYPDGRRAAKRVYRKSGDAWQLVGTRHFYYDGWNLVSEAVYTPDSGPHPSSFVRYLWGPDLAGWRDGRIGQEAGGIGGLLAVTVTSNGADRVYLPLTDGLGNVRGLVDAQTGTLAAEYAYDPYGVPLEVGGEAADLCPFRFQTKYWDAETGLYYYGYRYYDPLSCKWLRRDPKGEAGGWNLTAFCDCDPVNNYDPLGLAPQNVLEVLMPGIASSPAYQFSGNWGDPDDFRALELSGLGAARMAPELSADVFSVMFCGAGALKDNMDYYGSPWLAVNATYNPMVEGIEAAYESKDGIGYRPFNSGQRLSTGGRWLSAGRSAFSLAESGLMAYGGAKLGAPHVERLGNTLAHVAQGSSYGQARSLAEIQYALERGSIGLETEWLTPSAEAAHWQQNTVAYGYADAWNDEMLRSGTILYDMAYSKSGFYTSGEVVASCLDDPVKMHRSLQIMIDRAKGPRPGARIFIVKRDFPAAKANALANTTYGPGGSEEFFIQERFRKDEDYMVEVLGILLRKP